MRRTVVALVLVPLLSACSAAAAPAAPPAVEDAPAGAVVPVRPVAEDAPAGVVVPVRPAPVELPATEPAEPVVEAQPGDTAVPPGDPGTGAPAVPEPIGTQAHGHEHEELPGRVPAAALLRPVDLGPGWRAVELPERGCAPRAGGPSASAALAASDGSRLVETVAVAEDALGAVGSWRAALAGCGFSVAPLTLGELGVSAERAGERVLVTTSEQVVVVLRATGPLAADPALVDRADLALGTACPAAPDGCH